MKTTGILVLEFGSPSTSEVVRRLRQLGVYAEVHPADLDPAWLVGLDPRGIVLSGGGPVVSGEEPSPPRRAVFDAGLPILALGDGVLLLASRLRGRVRPGGPPAFELERVGILRQSPLFETLLGEGRFQAWMRTGATVDQEPPGFVVTAKGDRGGVAAMEHLSKRLFALRFHPEMIETEHGLQILANFAHGICECAGIWDLEDHAKVCQMAVRSRTGNQRVVCPLGDDPAVLVTAALLATTCGESLVPVVLDSPGLAPGRRAALLDFARGQLRHEAVIVPEAELPEPADLRLTSLARRLDAGYVLDPAGPTAAPARPDRREGRPPTVVHLWPLGQLFPDEVLHLARLYGVPSSVLAT